MVEGLEGVGEVVTGGLVARTLEPSAGEGAGHSGKCLNCGTQMLGDFCHECGQKGHVHRTLGAFWHDVAHSVLHFEGKIWRTLPLLAWKPGELTRRYIEGERARFVSPMALFLFSVFLMFAVVSTVGGPIKVADDVQQSVQDEQDYQRERTEMLAELREAEAERDRLRAEGKSTAAPDTEITVLRNAIALEERLRREEVARDTEEAQREAAEKAAPSRGVVNVEGGKAEIKIVRTGVGWIDASIAKAEKNPDLLIYKLQNNGYKFSWLLIPISVPFLWLLFLHRKKYRQYRAYDHTVFVTYSIAFMSLGFIALSLLRPLGLSDGIVGMIITFLPPIHMYRQLRGAYQLSRWSALWRTFVLVNFAFIAAGLFMAILLALGVLG